MGIAISTSADTVINKERTNTVQIAQNTCTATCEQIQQGNTVVLTNTTAGNITFSQECSASASCYMSNAVDQAVSVFQDAKATGHASPSLFPGIQINTTVNTTVNDIQNDLTQILQNFCHANVKQVSQDNVVYATDSNVGNIAFTQKGNANAACVMENTARMKINMQQQGTATGTAGGGLGGLIGSIIGVVIVIIIVIAVVSVARNTIKKKQEGQGEGGGGGGMFGGGQQGKGGGRGGGGKRGR